MGTVLGYSVLQTPIGELVLASTAKGLCAIEFGPVETALDRLQRWCDKHQLCFMRTEDDTLHQQVRTQLNEYFQGKRKEFTVPLDLYGTPFQLAVWRELVKVPYGQVRSYKEMAVATGRPQAVRAVGGANNRNPIPVIIPCHRVIGSDGSLVGYGGGLSIKEKLLRLEGYASPQKKLAKHA